MPPVDIQTMSAAALRSEKRQLVISIRRKEELSNEYVRAAKADSVRLDHINNRLLQLKTEPRP